MFPQQTKVDWQITDDDREWETLTGGFQHETKSENPFQLDWRSPRFWLKITAVLVCVMLTGLWRWHLYQADREQFYAELQSTLENEMVGAPGKNRPTKQGIGQDWPAPSNRARQVAHRLSGTLPDEADIKIRNVTIKDDYVLAEVVIARPAAGGGEQRYRTTRFYSRTTGEWRPIEPTPEMWGDEATIKTEHVIYRFREGDREAVEVAAPQIDAFYRTGETYLGLETNAESDKVRSDNDRFVLDVYIRALPDLSLLFWEEKRTAYGSFPARFEVPVEISDAVFLEQMLYLAAGQELITRLTAAVEPHQEEGHLDWVSMANTLRLWLLWQSDSALAGPSRGAAYRLLRDSLLNNRPYPVEQLPEDHQLCETYSLWRITPWETSIPVICTISDDELYAGGFISSDLTLVARPQRYMSYSIYEGELSSMEESMEEITLGLVLDYILNGYGPEKLADFLHEFSRHDNWESLIPGVFGVTLDEFRSGWLAYLAEEPL